MNTTLGGDKKDRVLLKSNGATTYFITDIANHYNKLSRGAQKMIKVWSADQAGQIRRLRFALSHFCDPDKQLSIVLYQMVRLFRSREEVKFSKRKGQTLTIPNLLELFDVDAVRWLILSQSISASIVINIDKEKKQNSKNTVSYIQYYSRACRIIKNVERSTKIHECKNFNLLTGRCERRMIVQMLSLEKLWHKINYSGIHLICAFLNSMAPLFNS
ncbi:arginine--tRNA ligase domain protein [Dictyocaulus viviparus]|uniref:Arginine--tRNA ligase domain protein n=1 Tax=Dictyocaulus viviparus TaxID=29172 RepID=A0A0D8XAB4_DICVI|nr:arginine--tRNA ligase domain protein [Dictyocaulus viviparus]